MEEHGFGFRIQAMNFVKLLIGASKLSFLFREIAHVSVAVLWLWLSAAIDCAITVVLLVHSVQRQVTGLDDFADPSHRRPLSTAVDRKSVV